MPTDPLDECRQRWRDAPPLTDLDLMEICLWGDRELWGRLVAELLRTRDAYKAYSDDRVAEIARLTAMVRDGHVHEWEPSGVQDDEGDVLALCGRGDCHAATYWYGEDDDD